jgi:uncharacterized protein YkwD
MAEGSTRRNFLQAGLSFLGLTTLERLNLGHLKDTEKTFDDIRANLLQMINEERAIDKLRPVVLDEFATRVATQHAREMAVNDFASHWGMDGLKPYHRYSFAGGTDATQENVSAADNTWSMKAADLKQDTAYPQVRLYQEKPPNDGHRRTILAPQQTHLGIGLAVEKLRLRMVQLFVARYVEVKSPQRSAKVGDKISFVGKLLKSAYSLNSIEVHYEPMPVAPELDWLRQSGSYSLPAESQVLRPRIPLSYVYSDRKPGVIEVAPDGSFAAPVTFFKDKPGIYTIVCWVKKAEREKSFPATEVCVRVE